MGNKTVQIQESKVARMHHHTSGLVADGSPSPSLFIYLFIYLFRLPPTGCRDRICTTAVTMLDP